MMDIVKIPKEDFDPILQDTHKAIFSGELPTDYFRYDYALSTVDGSSPISYALIQEKSKDVAELAYGGTVKEQRGFSSKESLMMFLNFLAKDFEYGVMQVRNNNFPMLRLGLSLGALITGTVLNRYGETYVCLQYKLRGEV